MKAMDALGKFSEEFAKSEAENVPLVRSWLGKKRLRNSGKQLGMPVDSEGFPWARS
jgi:hypothetical protein